MTVQGRNHRDRPCDLSAWAGVADTDAYKAVAPGGGLPRVTAHPATFSLCDLRQA